ncbi:MAG TPA: ATP-binding cassette domain-containing protein [Mycoplasmatales bacterium]|jgi:ABC-2 type transport system ATP-binding protein|nr:ATP-binding cassette domain-containing protein [Mycoplasmatales bacterium]
MNYVKELKIINVSKNYGDNLILDKLNYSFQTGKIYALLAPNGSGKTTFMRCISNLSSYKGVIVYNNFEIGTHFNNEIVYSTYEPLFENSSLKVISYLRQVCKLKELDFSKIIIKFKKTQTYSLRNKACFSLSTGEKKIFQLFLDLTTDPEVIIFDEPLNGLDFTVRSFVISKIKDLSKLNKLIIFSTHILSDLNGLVNEVLLIKDKKIINHSVDDIENFYKKNFSNEEISLT